MGPSVQLKSVTKRFGHVVAVDNVDLEIGKGEFYSLLGPSGCGKTTTLRLIGGLEVPNEGEVRISGRIVNDVPPYRRDCSIVFQNLALFPHMRVDGNIAFGLEMKKVPEGEIKKRVAEMLALVQLSGMGNRSPDELSGGQQQRVALARSIVLRPEVLLLDEPLASLDRKLRESMRIELRKIQREVGITFVYVTHDQEEALSMSDRVAVMKDGRLVQMGTPAEIHDHPRTRFVADFLGATNIFSGRVLSRTEHDVDVEIGAGLIVKASTDKEPPGGEISLAVRPESIEVLPKTGEWGGDNRFAAEIEEKVYLGDVNQVIVSLTGGARVTAHLTKRGRLNFEEISVGDDVSVGWNKEDSNILID